MKKQLLLLFTLCTCLASFAQTDVTSKYMQNPDFGARFAGWTNAGSFTFNVDNGFTKKQGEVFMEKWVSKGTSLGTNAGMYQKLRDLEDGTYTLVASAHNIQQSNLSKVCKGAYLYAGQEQVAINEAKEYSVVFTVANGKANVGVKLQSCDGNWVCIDGFKLYYNGVNKDSLAVEKARVDAEEADLRSKVENATGTAPKVTTYPFVPTGCTIALGRSTITGSGIKERGFCWSKNPNPTIFDERTTEYYSNNGNIYTIEGLKPATVYYVRAYAINNSYCVGYGDVVKIVTLPAGGVRYSYDFAGDQETNNRINSASAECVWMYNQLSNIQGFYLQVHYVPGAGAGDGTADCSYGGWMRVSEKVAYQQTGTILHETNHGVGVGTTGEWYNNGNLRADVSRGLWLGPRATQMVRFFENNATSTMTGDGTHMWPYGINGAHEDAYNPANYALYFANILITHAMHQDGLCCSASVGFATPAYVFQQDDDKKYYIKTESKENGGQTAYLTMTETGALRSVDASAEEVCKDDNFAWNITYAPEKSMYIFHNVGTGKYLTYSSGFKGTDTDNPGTSQQFQLLPCRDLSDLTSFWIIKDKKSALEASTYSTVNKAYSCKSGTFNASNAAVAQRWYFLTDDQLSIYESKVVEDLLTKLTTLKQNAESILGTPHHATNADDAIADIDNEFSSVINSIDTETLTSPTLIDEKYDELLNAMLTFLGKVSPDDVASPFDLTFMLVNPNFNDKCNGWSTSGAVNYSCCEFFEKEFDISQTTSFKVPAGTYEVKAQAFQRPGSTADSYTNYTKGTGKITTSLYIKTKTAPVKNIWDDAKSKAFGGSTTTQGGLYVPNTMEQASKWFADGQYDNSVMLKTNIAATMKVGIKSTSQPSAHWTIFDNFRLYYYGGYTPDDVTDIKSVNISKGTPSDNVYYNIQGQRISAPTRGLYIVNGKKVFIK